MLLYPTTRDTTAYHDGMNAGRPLKTAPQDCGPACLESRLRPGGVERYGSGPVVEQQQSHTAIAQFIRASVKQTAGGRIAQRPNRVPLRKRRTHSKHETGKAGAHCACIRQSCTKQCRNLEGKQRCQSAAETADWPKAPAGGHGSGERRGQAGAEERNGGSQRGETAEAIQAMKLDHLKRHMHSWLKASG